jgi:hypothetical protein
MEYYNYLKTIHFQPLDLNSLPTTVDSKVENMCVLHLPVIINNHGQVHGL